MSESMFRELRASSKTLLNPKNKGGWRISPSGGKAHYVKCEHGEDGLSLCGIYRPKWLFEVGEEDTHCKTCKKYLKVGEEAEVFDSSTGS
jgi:hypothetical protein